MANLWYVMKWMTQMRNKKTRKIGLQLIHKWWREQYSLDCPNEIWIDYWQRQKRQIRFECDRLTNWLNMIFQLLFVCYSLLDRWKIVIESMLSILASQYWDWQNDEMLKCSTVRLFDSQKFRTMSCWQLEQ